MQSPTFRWDSIDTVLVDMDGTLLDLAFDNFFWMELVPSRFAERHGMAFDAAHRELAERYRKVEGTLAWYCIDHWTRDLELDILALKRSYRHLIGYLPKAPEFLREARARGKRLLLVTNAHRGALEVKVTQTGLDGHVDALISSHDFRTPKESRQFWARLEAQEDVDPARALLIEDSLAVLQAARAFGLRHMLAVRHPDSRRPPRPIEGFDAIDGVADLT
jgi:putative hydrolase of the HAD superfamily